MTELSTFNEDSASEDLSIFSASPVEKSVDSKPSTKTVAAQGALLSGSGEGVVETFRTLSEGTEEERAVITDSITERVRQKTLAANKRLVTQLALNPDMSMADKETFLKALMGTSQETPNSMDLVATEIGALPSGDEDSVSEDIRLDAVEISKAVHGRMRQQQKILNGQLLATNKGGLHVLADFLDIVVPASESFITEQVVRDIRGGSVPAALEAFALLGNAKMGLQDYYMSLSSDEQVIFEQRLAEVLNSARGIIFTNDNDLAQQDLFRSIIDRNYYGTGSQVLDNVISILDMVGLGSLFKPVKRIKALYAATSSKIAARRMRSGVQPASTGKVVGEVNPEEARKLQAIVEADESDEAAQAIYGTTREEAVVDATAPQISVEDGSVVNTPHKLDGHVEEFIRSGVIELSPEELKSAQLAQVGRVQALNGVTNRQNMAQFKPAKLEPEGGIVYQNVYGPADSSYRTPQEGIDNVLFALRNYGIDESDLTVLQRQGDGNYAPISLTDYRGKKALKDAALEGKPDVAASAKAKEKLLGELREELTAEVSPRLTRGDRKNLLAEKRDLEKRLADVTDVPETPVKGKGISARKAKAEAVKLTAKTSDAERAIFQERIDLIDSKLAASKKGEVAEADLSRVEQGIIPERFKDRLPPTGGKPLGKPLPEGLKKEDFREDFLIQANFQHDFDLMDVRWDKLQVKRNFFDRIPLFNSGEKGKASLQRFFMDIHSMIDPRLSLGANVAVDRASAIETALVRISEDFVKPFTGLPDGRQVALMEVIENNNFVGKLTPTSVLRGRGFSQSEIDLLDKWKNSWDQVWHLENMDMVKSLKAGGYQRFEDKANKTNLIARKVGKNYTKKVGRVYDSALNKLRTVSDAELDELYANGGTLAKTKRTERLGESDFDYVLVRNQENKSLLRDLQESDAVLNYRPGYYTLRYKDPHIIVKQYLDEAGMVIREEAIETAGSKKAARLSIANRNRGESDSNIQYGFRPNKDRSIQQMDEDAWSISASSGRTAQRLRGQRLGTVESNLHANKLGAVEGPAESLLNSLRSISRRTAMREYLENYKKRFMDEYKELIKRDTNSGQLMFPKDSADFKAVGDETGKRMADARTQLEYIHYLENGYRSSIDDGWKHALNGMADALGGKTEYGEKFLRAVVEEIQNPTTWFKARAFDSYLALHPLRQFFVQAHQSSLLAANFPKYVLSQKMGRETAAIHMAMVAGDKLRDFEFVPKLIGMSADEALDLAEQYRRTGFDASIDRNNLVEKGLDNIADMGGFESLESAKKLSKTIVGASRKVGFDTGERINIMTSWLAHRNRALEEGKDITSLRVKDEIKAKARNYTYNMNAAGEMPYNKLALALLFQFMQVPHKAMLQMTNRALTRKERGRIAAYHALVMPMPVGIGYQMISGLGIEDEDAQDFIANGLEGLAVNRGLQLFFDGDTRIDISSLAAIDPNAPLDLILGFIELDAGEILSNAPSLSLFAGHNPRVTNILRETWNFITEPQDASIEESLALMNTFASFSSGWASFSQSFKELFVQEYDRRYNSAGSITDPSLTSPEKFAKMLGFGSKHEAYARATTHHVYAASTEALEDINKIYKLQKQAGVRRGLNVDHPEWNQYMLRAFYSANGLTQKQRSHYLSLVKKDIVKGESGVLGLIVNNLNLVSAEELRGAAIAAGVEDQITDLLDVIESAEEL